MNTCTNKWTRNSKCRVETCVSREKIKGLWCADAQECQPYAYYCTSKWMRNSKRRVGTCVSREKIKGLWRADARKNANLGLKAVALMVLTTSDIKRCTKFLGPTEYFSENTIIKMNIYHLPLWEWMWRNCMLGMVETPTLLQFAGKYARKSKRCVKMLACITATCCDVTSVLKVE